MSVVPLGASEKERERIYTECKEQVKDIIGEFEDISKFPENCPESISKVKNISLYLYWLGKDIMEGMSKADLIVFRDETATCRTCKAIKFICKLYDIPYITIK